MSTTWERITELFGAARALDPPLRGVFLDVACDGDAALRNEVERLLADDARRDSFLALRDHADDLATQLASFLRVDDVVKERYRVESRIASGGQAFVYRATDTVLSRPVILKVMRASGRQNRLLKRRFEHEMRALARIDHPGVVGILDVGELPDGCPFLVIQYVEGVSLREELQHGPLDRRRTAALLRQLGSALSSAHAAGVAHQDLKPENIMLQRLADGSEVLKLIDFGISKIDRKSLDSGVTSVMVAGTVRYMAPEQFQGENSAECDVYALALVTCEMLSGHPDARAPNQVNGRTRRLIESALAFRPSDRPRDVRRWCEQVAGTLEEGNVRRRQLLVGAAGLILTAVATTLPMRLLSRGGGEPRRTLEKVGAFDPLTEGFQIHNEIRGTVAFNRERNGYDGWRALTERAGHYRKDLTDEEKRLALDRGWTLTAVMRLEEGSCFAIIDFSAVGKRFDIDLHRNGDDDIVRLYTQIVPTFQGIDFPLPRIADVYHTYELRYDASLEMADLWIDGVKRLTGYRGHSQFQGDGDLIFGVGTYESARGVASFQQVRLQINP